jgi:hypothetical protein
MDHIQKMAAAVAWKWRGPCECETKDEYWAGVHIHSQQDRIIAAQAAFNALMDAVPDLVWEDGKSDDYIKKAITKFGTYFIHNAEDDFSGPSLDLVTHKDAEWFDFVTAKTIGISENVRVDTVDSLEKLASAHRRKLVSEIWGRKSDG